MWILQITNMISKSIGADVSTITQINSDPVVGSRLSMPTIIEEDNMSGRNAFVSSVC